MFGMSKTSAAAKTDSKQKLHKPNTAVVKKKSDAKAGKESTKIARKAPVKTRAAKASVFLERSRAVSVAFV